MLIFALKTCLPMLFGPNKRPYLSWSDLIRQRYGTRVQKLAVNAGFSCPNRDGTVGWGGCSFCNNEGFSPSYCHPPKPISRQIDEGLSFVTKRYPRARMFVAYFQAFSNTHAPLSVLMKRYGEALSHPRISGLVIGTRPDCVDQEKLDYLAELSGRHFIQLEYGIESCYDRTLERINRGHDFAASRRSVDMTVRRKLLCGAHMIFGLPGESREMMLEQVSLINALPLDSIKFHQLQIVKGTPMASQYMDDPQRFALFELDEYIDFMVSFVERMRPDLAIDRFSGEVPPRLIAGKRWENVRADTVAGLIERRLRDKGTFQGKLFAGRPST